MYILFITRGYPSDKYKGNGIFEFDQAKALNKIGCKVIYASVDVRSIRRWRKFGFEKKKIDGIDIYCINIPLGKIPSLILDKVSIYGFRVLYHKILKKEGKPDILHAHFTNPGYTAAALRKELDIPLVITEHSSLVNNLNIEKHIFNKACFAYTNADAVIAVSPALSYMIEKNFNIKTLCIPNIVDATVFNYSPRLNCAEYNIISTGNLIYSKRMDLTIQAFNNAFYNNESVTLTIFGEGPERTKLENMVKKYKLEKKVIFKGMCSRSEIAEYLKRSDCFVLASQSETFGVAYIEALAAGVPVVATKCGGPEEFINKSNGILIPVDDIDALSNALIYMYKNKNNYNREIISNFTTSTFSSESVANKLLETYLNVQSR